jgi:5-formyltetrahydrofolate cyclo-ligase
MSDSNGPSSLKDRIRRSMVAKRIALDERRRVCLDALICGHVLQAILQDQQRGQTVAAYLSHRGEPNLLPICETLGQSGRQIYLPVVSGQVLRFHHFDPNASLTPNRFGILEPIDQPTLALEEIDWILLPTVAFSPRGARLGMGGGFYDRTLGELDTAGRRPRLAGIAYSFQQVDALPSEEWDVPLDLIISDQGILWVE